VDWCPCTNALPHDSVSRHSALGHVFPCFGVPNIGREDEGWRGRREGVKEELLGVVCGVGGDACHMYE